MSWRGPRPQRSPLETSSHSITPLAPSVMVTCPSSPWAAAGMKMPTERRSAARDRKSTRLNSSHSQISYAVFCLKQIEDHVPDHPIDYLLVEDTLAEGEYGAAEVIGCDFDELDIVGARCPDAAGPRPHCILGLAL